MRAVHALVTVALGLTVAAVWIRALRHHPRRAPAAAVVASPAVDVLGLGHRGAYDFAVGHWAGDFGLLQALVNVVVGVQPLVRRARVSRVG